MRVYVCMRVCVRVRSLRTRRVKGKLTAFSNDEARCGEDGTQAHGIVPNPW